LCQFLAETYPVVYSFLEWLSFVVRSEVIVHALGLHGFYDPFAMSERVWALLAMCNKGHVMDYIMVPILPSLLQQMCPLTRKGEKTWFSKKEVIIFIGVT
jgi:membrane protein YqaA with SNARE-associated domain